MTHPIAPVVRRQTIADALHRTALRLPDKLAIACGDTRWTYADFNALVSRLAAGLAHLGVEEGVNVTLGLPLVRTSPDHGTAFDIAGTGRADPSSMAAAIRMARAMSA